MADKIKIDSVTMKYISAFILVVIGIALLTSIADTTGAATGSIGVVNESFSIASARLGSNNINSSVQLGLTNKGPACAGGYPSGSVVLTTTTGVLIADTNYTVNYATEKITLVNTTYWIGTGSNSTLAAYQYYPTSYLCEGWTRSVTNMIPGFFALALLGIALWIAFSAYKESEGLWK